MPAACDSVWLPTSTPATVTPGRITGSGCWAPAAGASSIVEEEGEGEDPAHPQQSSRQRSRMLSSKAHVVPRAARPVSTPRWPPGAVSRATDAALGTRSPTWWQAGTGAIPSPRPATASSGAVTPARSIVRPVSAEPPLREVVGAEEAVVELAEGAAGVGVHAGHEVVDGLDLRQQVAIVEVRGDRVRLHQVLLDPGQLVAAAHQRRGRAAEHSVELGDPLPARDRGDRPQRRDDRHAREVERAADERDVADRQVRVAGMREQREDAAEAPADQVHGPIAGVRGRGADGLGDDRVEPVLEPERAVGELDLAVVDDVDLVAGQQQVLGERAAAPQVEAERRRGERRHEQHGAATSRAAAACSTGR